MTAQTLFRHLACLAGLALGPTLAAQGAPTGPPVGPPLSDEQLEALVAPFALYPDLLVAQVIEASKDPSTLVAAGDLLASPGGGAKPPKQWPGAVKALLHVPTVIELMDQSLPWTTRLGNAVKRSHPPVLQAVQRVRVKVSAAGNLVSDDKLKVVPGGEGVLKIELVDPATLFVPEYDPEQLYVKHEAGGEPWIHYGPGITIPGFKDVAAGLASAEYVHTEQQSHNHYYGEQGHTTTRVIHTPGIARWSGWGYHNDNHHHHHH